MSNNNNDKWREKLSPNQFYVTRQKGTERPFSSDLLKNKKEGKYLCLCCETELFPSSTKYESGCGWPAFYAASDESKIVRTEDSSHGMQRVEVTCKECGAHLGHVFEDGPRPTGERFCINGIALKFVPK